ncbi:MAG: tetraacyldisaccharide 4'-kinase [Paludibacteraceae bacterium]|nr:tetraacyldisaccharide 4'-kinase [Paludibacteraceae bacterium]
MKLLHLLRYLLTPLSWLYSLGVWLRNELYDDRILPSYSVNVPTIAVGNLALGGTGKTPMTEYLIRLLSPNYKIAVLSRGYGRKTTGFRLAGADDTAKTIGDEPMLIHTHFPDIPVAVCADRVHGIKHLQHLFPDLQCVILDDAYQHRKLRAGFYILLTSYNNLYVNDYMLPRGLLRDLPSECTRANAVVVTKCPCKMQPIERRIVSNSLRLATYQQLYYSSIIYADVALPATPLLIAGIANPTPLLEHLQQQFPHTELLDFADHHQFTKQDIRLILNKAAQYECVVTTEKDYMRMQNTKLIDELADKLYVMPIQTDFIIDKEVFDRQILLYVSENNRKNKL